MICKQDSWGSGNTCNTPSKKHGSGARYPKLQGPLAMGSFSVYMEENMFHRRFKVASLILACMVILSLPTTAIFASKG
ncbi:hypothetical protein MGH68_10355 [Erysipelothrix sp. D19-032]